MRFILGATILLLGLALAQADPRVEALWSRYSAHLAAVLSEDLVAEMQNADVIQLVMSVNSVESEGEIVSTHTLDYVERSVLSTTESGGDYPFTTRTLYRGGKVTFFFTAGDITERSDPPANQAAELAATLEQTFDQIDEMRDPEKLRALSEKGGTGTYEGYRVYGDILAGEQVALNPADNLFAAAIPGEVATDISVVFTPNGYLAGQLMRVDGEQLLIVYKPPTAFPNGPAPTTMRTYTVKGDTFVWQSDVTTQLIPNPVLSEGFYDPPAVTE